MTGLYLKKLRGADTGEICFRSGFTFRRCSRSEKIVSGLVATFCQLALNTINRWAYTMMDSVLRPGLADLCGDQQVQLFFSR